jgi:hypothetical protein
MSEDPERYENSHLEIFEYQMGLIAPNLDLKKRQKIK